MKFPDVELLEQFEPSKIYRDICSQDGPMEALRNTGGRISRNERASFLVGHAIDGDAILATVGSTWTSDGRCIYDNFTLSCFHRYALSNILLGSRSSSSLFLKERFLETYVPEHVMDSASLSRYAG